MSNLETVLAVYDSYDTANNAVRDLVDAGFSRSVIGLAANDVTGEYAHLATDEDVTGSEGAGFGAAVGGVTGAVASLAAIVIPGVGPIIAAGPLVALLGGATGAVVGAAAGAVAGGLAASLIHLGIPDEDAGVYAETVRRGGALVTVTTTTDEEADKATSVLRSHHPVDMDRRVSQWRETGWKGYDPQAEPYKHHELLKEREMYPGDTSSIPDDDTVRRYPPVR